MGRRSPGFYTFHLFVTFHISGRHSHVYVWQFVVGCFFYVSLSLSVCFPLLVVSFNRISVGFIIIFVRRQPIALQCIRIVRAGEYERKKKNCKCIERRKKNCTRSTHTHNGETKIYSLWQTSLLFSDSVGRACAHECATNATISMCRLKGHRLSMWLPLISIGSFFFGFGVDVWLRAFNDNFIWE